MRWQGRLKPTGSPEVESMAMPKGRWMLRTPGNWPTVLDVFPSLEPTGRTSDREQKLSGQSDFQGPAVKPATKPSREQDALGWLEQPMDSAR
jgi:hypothetical protein